MPVQVKFSSIFPKIKVECKTKSTLPYPSKRSFHTKSGDHVTEYCYMFDEDNRPVLAAEIAFNQEKPAIEVVETILEGIELNEHQKVQVILGKGGFGVSGIPTPHDSISDAISICEMPFISKDVIIETLENQIEEIIDRYDGNVSSLVVNDIRVNVRTMNPSNGAAGTMRRTVANQLWLIPGEYNTQENCFYVSWGMCNDPKKFAEGYLRYLRDEQPFPDFKDYASKKKRHMKAAAERDGHTFYSSYVDDEQIKVILRYSRQAPIIRIYDGQFKLIHEHKPANITPSTRLFEFQRAQNHYRPMLRWTLLNDDIKQEIKDALVARLDVKPEEKSKLC